MKIVAVELENFRRFRAPLRLSGFADGLNVVVEPNERGKSTLLEAMRAALFIRHTANTELTRSYCPTGDNVAPRVGLEFELRGERWQIDKQFLRSTHVKLTGPNGRFDGDAAEDRLQTLLGFERGNNRGTDPETRGVLGLLWVEQASALGVAAPGRLVQDNVRSALENEVGAVIGGRRYEAVRGRVETDFGTLRTRTGRPTGRLAAAEERATRARARREEAEALARAHETTLSELEQARTSKRLVERELADEGQARIRPELEADLKLAETAAERLSTAQARHDIAANDVDHLDERIQRIEAAEKAIEKAIASVAETSAALAEHQGTRDEAIKQEADFRQAVGEARRARDAAEKALGDARAKLGERERAAALARAVARHKELVTLEAELATNLGLATLAIDAGALEDLKSLDRAVVEAGAVVSAGAVRIAIQVHDATRIRIDGEDRECGSLELSRATTVEIGEHASICITPPGAGAASAAGGLESAREALADALTLHGLESYAQGVERADAARSAAGQAKAIKRQIETLCVADPSLSLEAGPAPLKALFSSPTEVNEPDVGTQIDLQKLEAASAQLSDDDRAAAGRHDSAAATLRAIETLSVTLASSNAGAERDLENAKTQLGNLVQSRSKELLAADLATARQELLRRQQERDDAETAAKTFDADGLRRRIVNMDKASESARERRTELIGKISGLEATIATEGARGPAGQLAEAQEEELAATDSCARLIQEADMLDLLKGALARAHETGSRTFLAPVTRRAVSYVNRILPGCQLTFSEELGLASITRAGVSEGCGDLSRGTQEQLAVLTRLAFADLLLERGMPVSLILDDPLVYSDDTRFDTMTEILTSAADRMQVILLTCRERAFRHLGGTRIAM